MAKLRSGDAEIMFEGAYGPSDPDRQRVLFYLYSDDLAALRAQLVAVGIDAGQIEAAVPARARRCGSPTPTATSS